MRSVHEVQRRLLFIPCRCFLALAWLAHNTFLRSPGPKIVPPFIRRRACFTLQGSGLIRVDADGNLKGLFCLRVDLPKNRAPFHLVALFQVFQDHGIQ